MQAESAVKGWGQTPGWGQHEDIKGGKQLGSSVVPTLLTGMWMTLTTLGKTVDSSEAEDMETT